jgi:phosphoglucomutase
MSQIISPLAGKPAPKSILVDIPKLLAAYVDLKPDPSVPGQRVAFGTSGHRGSSFDRSFNESHILAISQAICEYRQSKGIDGPLFIGADTHALSQPAFQNALEVLAANGVANLRRRQRYLTRSWSTTKPTVARRRAARSRAWPTAS